MTSKLSVLQYAVCAVGLLFVFAGMRYVSADVIPSQDEQDSIADFDLDSVCEMCRDRVHGAAISVCKVYPNDPGCVRDYFVVKVLVRCYEECERPLSCTTAKE